MKEYTLLFIFCLISLIAAATVSAQGFTGPGTNPPPSPPDPGYNPPPPPSPGLGHYPLPPPPSHDHNPPPPPPGPGHYPLPPSPPPGQVWNVTVEQAKNYSHDSWVIINGNIVSVLPGGRHFMFRDSSGEIPVEIGPKEWRGLSVGASDRIEISGEVKKERGQVFIKVHAIRKI
jgi:uncharacterized protein YdeI (BOF family)